MPLPVPEIDVVREEGCYLLCHNLDNDRYTVVKRSRRGGQVYSTMPTDGSNFASFSDAGIAYVANWYSKSYAMRVFRDRVRERRELLA